MAAQFWSVKSPDLILIQFSIMNQGRIQACSIGGHDLLEGVITVDVFIECAHKIADLSRCFVR